MDRNVRLMRSRPKAASDAERRAAGRRSGRIPCSQARFVASPRMRAELCGSGMRCAFLSGEEVGAELGAGGGLRGSGFLVRSVIVRCAPSDTLSDKYLLALNITQYIEKRDLLDDVRPGHDIHCFVHMLRDIVLACAVALYEHMV